MSANLSPIFIASPNNQQSQVTVANTNRDGTTGTYVTCWTPGVNGSILSKVVVEVPGVAAGDVIRLFWNDGSTTRLYLEIQVTATTPGVGTSCFRFEYVPSTPEVYPSGWSLKASTNQGQATNILVLGGNY